ncbi:MAG: hypothetical protein LC121_13905, partial [Anaerolineae bacterium]|nr:hypothetical protein [Anaerolineae bacterium]
DTVDSALGGIETRIGRLTEQPFVVTLSVTGGGGGEGGGTRRTGGAGVGGFAEFAGGGYTGDGAPHEVAGSVHKGEWVVPRGGALVLVEGERKRELSLSGGTFILQGVQDPQKLYDELRRIAERRA